MIRRVLVCVLCCRQPLSMVSDAELDEFVTEIEAEKEEAGKQPTQLNPNQTNPTEANCHNSTTHR